MVTTLAELNFDAIADGTTIGNGSTALSPFTVNATATATVLSSSAIHGARGFRLAATATGFWQGIYAETAHTNQRSLVQDIRPSAIAVATYFGALLNGASNIGNWRINTDGTVTIRNATTAVATSVIALDLTGATAYRFEWLIKSGTTGQEMKVFEGDSTTALFTLTGALSVGTRTGFYFGFGAAANGSAADFDNVRVGDDYLGPPTVTAPGGMTIVSTAVAVLGDSLTGMSGSGTTLVTNALGAHGWDTSKVEVSGITGRLIWGGSTHPDASETIDTWRADNIDAGVWIVGLGANNQGASQAALQGYYMNLLTKIGPGRKLHFIDQGYQGQSENLWSFNGANAIGARYTKNGTTGVSEVNAAIRNVADLANATPATYPVCTVHNWNDYAPMRALGDTAWNVPSDTSSIGGTARHMSSTGYAVRAEFYALAIDSELPPSSGKFLFLI